MSLKDIMIADLNLIVQDLDSPYITWQGEQYICSASSEGEELTLGEGFQTANTLSVTITSDQFGGTFPKEQQLILYNDTTYRIEKVIKNVNVAFIRLICVSPTRM